MELIVRSGEREEEVHLEKRSDGSYQVTVGDAVYEIDAAHVGSASTGRSSNRLSLRLAEGQQFEVGVLRTGNHGSATYDVSSNRGLTSVEVTDPLTRLAEKAAGDGAGSKKITAYMPGRVVEVLVSEGDEVTNGQGVVVLEAMKMKNEICSESDGTVQRLFVAEGQNVEGGDPLFEIA